MENVASIGRGERCTKLVIHHSGHTNTDRGRGSSAVPAGVDFEWRVEPGKLEFTKQKDLKIPDTAFSFYLNEHVVGKDEDGKDVTSCAAVWCGTCAPTVEKKTAKPGKHTGVLRCLLEAEGGRATKETWRSRFREATPSLEPRAARNAFARGVEKMVAAGQVGLNGDAYELVPMKARLERVFNAGTQGTQGTQQGLMNRGKARDSKDSTPLRGESLSPAAAKSPTKPKKKPRPGDSSSRQKSPTGRRRT